MAFESKRIDTDVQKILDEPDEFEQGKMLVKLVDKLKTENELLKGRIERLKERKSSRSSSSESDYYINLEPYYGWRRPIEMGEL